MEVVSLMFILSSSLSHDQFGPLVMDERVFVHCLCLSSAAVAMSNNDGLLVPKPTRMAGPADEGRTLARTLVIESGHTPLRTRLETCNRALNGPLRRRHVYWVPRVMFEDMIRVWALLRGHQLLPLFGPCLASGIPHRATRRGD